MTSMFSRILVAVDASAPARLAVVLGARLAHEHDGDLLLCHCVDWMPIIAQLEASGAIIDPTPTVDAFNARATSLLTAAAECAARYGIQAKRGIVEGSAQTGILQLAGEQRCGLIVMGAHAGSGFGRLLIGNTTNAVLRASSIPVLTVREGIRIADEGRCCFARIMVATDESEPSVAALETALALPPEDRRELIVCSVADANRPRDRADSGSPNGLVVTQARANADRAVAIAQAQGIAVKSRVIEGDPRVALVAQAAHEDADLIVIGSHGRRGIERLVLGSVAEYVVRTAPLPVLVVRTGAANALPVVHASAANPLTVPVGSAAYFQREGETKRS